MIEGNLAAGNAPLAAAAGVECSLLLAFPAAMDIAEPIFPVMSE
jgi:hypothetical protein